MGLLTAIDVNVLDRQSAGFFAKAFDAYIMRGDQLAVPDAAVFEMTSNRATWEGMLVDGLSHLALDPNAIVLMKTTWDLRRSELASGSPALSFVDEIRTVGFRELIRDAGKKAGPFLANVRRQIPVLWPWSEREAIKKFNVDGMRSLHEHAQSLKHRTQTDAALAARIKTVRLDMQGRDYGALRAFLCEALDRAQEQAGLQRQLVAIEGLALARATSVSEQLWRAPSVCALYALALGALSLRRYFIGGVSDLVSNSVVDLEYVVAGLFAGCLVTNDRGARDTFEDLKCLGRHIWPSHAEWFDLAQVCTSAQWEPLP